MPKEKLNDRARDELFSHINRCGVLQASPEDAQRAVDMAHQVCPYSNATRDNIKVDLRVA